MDLLISMELIYLTLWMCYTDKNCSSKKKRNQIKTINSFYWRKQSFNADSHQSIMICKWNEYMYTLLIRQYDWRLFFLKQTFLASSCLWVSFSLVKFQISTFCKLLECELIENPDTCAINFNSRKILLQMINLLSIIKLEFVSSVYVHIGFT